MSRPQKRTRPLSDLDDQDTGFSKKKRRLRLYLITSRLSRPFSIPASHVVDRGSSKIAVWAKRGHFVPQAMRKAAIMNHVRRRIADRETWLRKNSGISGGEEERRVVLEKVGTGKLVEQLQRGPNHEFGVGHPVLGKEIMPSPLGLSNYDALDDEDDYDDGYFDETESEHGRSTRFQRKAEKREKEEDRRYYSDWNFFDALEDRKDEDGYDDPFSLSMLSSGLTEEERPSSPLGGRDVEFLKEREREVMLLGSNRFSCGYG